MPMGNFIKMNKEKMKSRATILCKNQFVEAINHCLLNICSNDREIGFKLDAVKYMAIANISASSMEKNRPFIEIILSLV